MIGLRGSLFKLEHFGTIVYIDPSEDPLKMFAVKTSDAEINTTKVRCNIWRPIETIHDFDNMVFGLIHATRILLHPSILSADRIARLHAQLRFAVVQHDGCAPIHQLFNAFKYRLSEYAAAFHNSVTRGEVNAAIGCIEDLSGAALNALTLATRAGEAKCMSRSSSWLAELGETLRRNRIE